MKKSKISDKQMLMTLLESKIDKNISAEQKNEERLMMKNILIVKVIEMRNHQSKNILKNLDHICVIL